MVCLSFGIESNISYGTQNPFMSKKLKISTPIKSHLVAGHFIVTLLLTFILSIILSVAPCVGSYEQSLRSKSVGTVRNRQPS